MPPKNNQLKLSDNPNINKTNTLPKSRGRSGNGHDANPPSSIAKPPPKAKPKPKPPVVPVAPPPPSTSSLTPIILSTIATENPPNSNFFVLNTVDYTIPAGSQLTIGANQTLYLVNNNNFVNNGSLQIFGILTVQGTFINNGNITTILNSIFQTGTTSGVSSSNLITNKATMKFGGFFSLGTGSNDAIFTNEKTGTVTTMNTFYQSGILNNSGNFNINGSLTINSGTINNNGNITNSANSNIQNNNTINNNINIENLGTISNGNIINNQSIIYNSGSIVNAQGAVITPPQSNIYPNQPIQL